jgi:succinate-acetate transporter protein
VFTSIKNPYQLMGTMLALVLAYLLLTNADGTTKVAGAVIGGWNGLLLTLQGRKRDGSRA